MTCSFVIMSVVNRLFPDTITPLPPLAPDRIFTIFFVAWAKTSITVIVGVGVIVGERVGIGV